MNGQKTPTIRSSAAEVVYTRADADKTSMSLKAWKGAPTGKISAEIVKAHAFSEFEKYRIVQDRLFESDFEKQVRVLDTQYKKQISSGGEGE